MAKHAVVIAEDGGDRKHRPRLCHFLESTSDRVRIASAYVTDRELLLSAQHREIRLVTSLLPMDIASGATSLESLGALIEGGVNCRIVAERPRLHAKVYIFGTDFAVVSSANLTESALHSNIEVGVEITGQEVGKLAAWFDQLWETARPLQARQLAVLRETAVNLRKEYVKLKNKSSAALRLPSESLSAGFSDDVLTLFQTAERFFICNTDRRHGERTPTGGYLLEEKMRSRSYAAAWESFKFPSHMELVQPGDAIFMFAKGIGIIAIGRANARCEKLKPGDPDRVYNARHQQVAEWRVDTHWLDWRDSRRRLPLSVAKFYVLERNR